jgi:plastocyanin
MRRRLAIVAGIFLVVAVAAGGSLAAPPKEPTCAPEGDRLTIAAHRNRFDKDCLMAPADQAFTIAFNNKETEPHNVSIYDEANGNKTLYKGEIFLGPRTVTYSVPALPEGRYLFLCDPHDEAMRGVFVVGNPPATSSTTAPPATTTTTAPLLPLPGS